MDVVATERVSHFTAVYDVNVEKKLTLSNQADFWDHRMHF